MSIKQQKSMLENIQASMNSVGEASPKRVDNMNQFQQELTALLNSLSNTNDIRKLKGKL